MCMYHLLSPVTYTLPTRERGGSLAAKRKKIFRTRELRYAVTAPPHIGSKIEDMSRRVAPPLRTTPQSKSSHMGGNNDVTTELQNSKTPKLRYTLTAPHQNADGPASKR